MKEDLADYVRRVMHQKGLRYRDVVERSGKAISSGYINDIINRKTINPSVQKLTALATGLGENFETLMAIAKGEKIEESARFKDSRFADLLNSYEALNEQDQKEVSIILDCLQREIEFRRKL